MKILKNKKKIKNYRIYLKIIVTFFNSNLIIDESEPMLYVDVNIGDSGN